MNWHGSSGLRNGTEVEKEEAAKELLNLAYDNPDNKVAIAEAGAIPPLAALARDGTKGQKETAAGALAYLADDTDNQVAIAKAGGIGRTNRSTRERRLQKWLACSSPFSSPSSPFSWRR